ncbi:MAG: lipopolysaccharide biosynthesis protein [Candidatus Acidiferrales bacterium]
MNPSIPKWLSWAKNGSAALLDQGLISGSNFLIGILLARCLTTEQYGAYGLAYAIVLLFFTSFQAFLYEPMTVFGSSLYKECQREYMHGLLRIYAALAATIFIALGAAAWFARALGHSASLPGALFGVALLAPCLMLYGLARAGFYFQLRPQSTIIGSLSYCAVVLSGLWVLSARGLLSPFVAFLLMALAAGGSGGFLLSRFRRSLQDGASPPTPREICLRHWEYGRWALASSTVFWIPNNIYYLVVGGVAGLTLTARLRALMNLSTPFSQVIAALTLILLPYTARQYQESGHSIVEGVTRNIMKMCAVSSLGYWGLLILFRYHVLHFLYHDRYTDIAEVLPWLALSAIIWVVANGPTIGLRAMGKPSSVFVSYCVASGVTLLIGIPAALLFGIRGILAGMILSSLAAVISGWLQIRRRAKVHARTLLAEKA